MKEVYLNQFLGIYHLINKLNYQLRVLFLVLCPKIVHHAPNLFDLNVEKFMELRHPIEQVALTATNVINVVDLES